MDFGRTRMMRQPLVLENVCIIPGPLEELDAEDVELNNFTSAVIFHASGRDIYYNWTVKRGNHGVRLMGSKTYFKAPVQMKDCYLSSIYCEADYRRAEEVTLPNRSNLLSTIRSKGAKSRPSIPFTYCNDNLIQFWMFFRTPKDEKSWKELKSALIPALIDGRKFDDMERNLCTFLSQLEAVNHPLCTSSNTSERPGNLFERWRRMSCLALMGKLESSSLDKAVEHHVKMEVVEIGLGLGRHLANNFLEEIEQECQIQLAGITLDDAGGGTDLDLSHEAQATGTTVNYLAPTATTNHLMDLADLADNTTLQARSCTPSEEISIDLGIGCMMNQISQSFRPAAKAPTHAPTRMGVKIQNGHRNLQTAIEEMECLERLFEKMDLVLKEEKR
ncbi:hypothetical protein H072_852 [Dactylellina haptotyla CBS 200.50]|uniref:Uncharacterized protein n=1 Tax=Dactylellina haptotyla (strain CBS 200.50) TaxID=1284197 RepID=S8C093_DACHA|nr:hypothetical protein H072_852 [Dactylellina haptotyla CBS 200.50]